MILSMANGDFSENLATVRGFRLPSKWAHCYNYKPTILVLNYHPSLGSVYQETYIISRAIKK